FRLLLSYTLHIACRCTLLLEYPQYALSLGDRQYSFASKVLGCRQALPFPRSRLLGLVLLSLRYRLPPNAGVPRLHMPPPLVRSDGLNTAPLLLLPPPIHPSPHAVPRLLELQKRLW